MNKHLQTMKNALASFEKDAAAWNASIAEHNRLFKPEEAEKANTPILEKLEERRRAVRQIIQDEMEGGQRDAAAWGQLDPAKITDDAKLLDAGMVNPDQFRGLVQKYQGNATMQQLLAKYAEKNSGPAFNWGYDGKKDTRPYYDTSGIMTAEKKAAEFDRHAGNAFYIAERIGKTGRDLGHSPEALQRAIDAFGSDAESL